MGRFLALNVSWLITRSVGYRSVVVNLVDVVHVCCKREAAVSTVTCTNMHRSDLNVHAGPEVDQSPLLGCFSTRRRYLSNHWLPSQRSPWRWPPLSAPVNLPAFILPPAILLILLAFLR